ncbi:MerR family transcriptional regulator [Bradyrhizobium roseum]|uniref:MerR family transcriptional regulator n=1 Tax=Bradyrhizobium roseum TaxID=3056648 RepID=UPI002625C201|nr:MerR family transcriptional regulator [Bradyrhizobium roseus]WKA31509.1 MerR family transcriptional regulator [Bradyrhizobium roseus]
MDKAPDAFRTISEVAEELDIPQHVLRFWETRFAQIKPMKRSGGRRYYRPDDVDLLKGIRRLLYGEGYTIRGVQRILKEHGIKSVQGLADQASAVTFGAVEEAIGLSLQEPDEEADAPTADAEPEDEDDENDEKEIDYRFVDTDDDGMLLPFVKGKPGPSDADRERLERVLQDLVACRQLLDNAIKDG